MDWLNNSYGKTIGMDTAPIVYFVKKGIVLKLFLTNDKTLKKIQEIDVITISI